MHIASFPFALGRETRPRTACGKTAAGTPKNACRFKLPEEKPARAV